MHTALAGTGWHLLLCGPTNAWDIELLTRLRERHGHQLTVHHLNTHETPDALHPLDHHPLPMHSTAQYLIRSDGHLGYRAGGTDLTPLTQYLDHWLPTASKSQTS